MKKYQIMRKYLRMTKYLALTLALICILELTGCGTDEQQGTGDGGLSILASNDAEGVTQGQQGEVQQEDSRKSGLKQDEEQKNDSQLTNSQQDNVSVSVEKAEYTYDNLYLSVEIPKGWDYKVKTAEEMAREDGLVICAIDFWSEEYPETVFELGYMTFFGMCATGVTIEEFTLPNGLGGHRYTETLEDTLWLTIALRHPNEDISHGTYCIMASPELSVWEAVEPEFEKILDSVEVGSLLEESE